MPKIKSMEEKLWKQKTFHCGDRHLAQIEELLDLSGQPNFTRLMHHILEVGYAYYTGQIKLEAETTEEAKALYLHRIEQTRQEVLRLQALACNPSASTTAKMGAIKQAKALSEVVVLLEKMMRLEMSARNVLDVKAQADINVKRDTLELAKQKHEDDLKLKIIEIEERR